MRDQHNQYWLFSQSIDLAAFLGSAIFSLVLLAIGWQFGFLNSESPEWTWIGTVLLIDVAHVWSTSFRVYFDREEFQRRILLYTLVPVFGYIFGVFLYSEGEMVFWRVLAYIAVFHFVRQQFGWVKLYRKKANETSQTTFWIDTLTIYLATIYPLVFWMTSPKRNFDWFIEGDFISLPSFLERIFFVAFVVSISAYIAKTIYQYLNNRFLNPGKDIVVATTVVCWYVGIVALNSDYAFTVTNVVIHGVPYFVLIYFYARMRREKLGGFYKTLSSNWLVFLATLWMLAYVEELFWDKTVWHERSEIFGGYLDLESWKMYIVPILALPQLTHYVLDGFIWKRKNNEGFRMLKKDSA